MSYQKAAAFIALLVVTGVASAIGAVCDNCAPVNAPELDPASVVSGLTLLAGGLTVLRGRRSRKS